jgi:hypothetical protein
MLYCNLQDAYDNGVDNFQPYDDNDGQSWLNVTQVQTQPQIQPQTQAVEHMSSNQSQIMPKRIKSHPYYIKKFMNSFTDDDLVSLASNYDNDLYAHISSCKYCRMKINYEMKKRFINELSNFDEFDGYGQHYQPKFATNNVVQPRYQSIQHIPQKQLYEPMTTATTANAVDTPTPNQTTLSMLNSGNQYLLIIFTVVLIFLLFIDIIVKIVR